ncbi:MAG TPA: universal stress protein [Solirubrobacteraceae bacterium]|nr:universal stress protein [Solirubrobacteraceae bacterium]
MYETIVIGATDPNGTRDALLLARQLGSANARCFVLRRGEREPRERAASHLERAATRLDAGLVIVAGPNGRAIATAPAGPGDDGPLLWGERPPHATVVIPERYRRRRRRVTAVGLAYEPEQTGSAAVAHAVLLARQLGGELVPLTVIDPCEQPDEGGSVAGADLDALFSALRRRIGRIGQHEIELVVGTPSIELDRFSDRVDVIVCGSGAGRGNRPTLGSTTGPLAAHARCPVLIAPPSDQRAVARWEPQRERPARAVAV